MGKSNKKSVAENQAADVLQIIEPINEAMTIEDLEAQEFNWNIGYIVEMLDNNNIDLDILVQRGYVWNRKKDSALISSVLTRTPIQSCYMNKVDGVYGVIDGKQRLTAIYNFVKGNYKLHQSTPPIMVNGQIFKIAGYNFESLPEKLQTRILNYSIRGDWFDNLLPEKEMNLFFLINSGRPVNAAEISRSRIKSKKTFISLANHPAMTIAINESNKRKHKHIDILSQIWCLCYAETPSLLQKDIGPILSTTEVTKEQEDQMTKAFDYLTAYYQYIMTEDKKRLPKIQKPTHILSLGYMAFLASQREMTIDSFVECAKNLFNGEGRTVTNNEQYNYAVGAGSAKPEQITIRKKAIQEALNL